jgi:RNA polymerase sigma factor (sigma-70 family)
VSRRVSEHPPIEPDSEQEFDLETVFARFQAELLGSLVCLLGNAEDARDALQEAFVKCWKHRESVPQVQNLKAWVFRIVLNTGRDIRGTAWRRRRQSLPEDESLVTSPLGEPTQMLETQEEAERVRRAVSELREEEQLVFLMRQNGEMTYDEIAAELGIPTGTVKTRMRLALTRLRETLANDG